jgi:predicted RND superfamily exporter protein
LDRFAHFVVERRQWFAGLFGLAVLVSAVLIPRVHVNYDNTRYLPEAMPTREAIAIHAEEFGAYGTSQVLMAGVSIPEALQAKREIAETPAVRDVIWLDDFADLTIPLEFLASDLVARYYRGDHALFDVLFVEDDYSPVTGRAVASLRRLGEGTALLRGPAVDALVSRERASREIMVITVLAVPIFLLILAAFTTSWFEPLLIMATVGASVIINMGTNMLLGEVSFITQAAAPLLQFAVTMDYSIFLLHRFAEERAAGAAPREAMVKALTHSAPSISASSLTTVAGFAALMAMRYGIGTELGLVLVKGVALSLAAVMAVLPGLVVVFERPIERTRHRPFVPELRTLGRRVLRQRYVVPIVVIILLPIAYLGQAANHFLYGESLDPGGERQTIEEVFGTASRLVLIVPAGNISGETAVSRALDGLETVEDVRSLAMLADPGIPRSVLPETLRGSFEGDRYSRFVMQLATPAESHAASAALADIEGIAEQHYPGAHRMLGVSPAIRDIREVVGHDFRIVSLLSIVAVGAIILLAFRSLALPILLVFTIQSSIWFNMAVPYFLGVPLIFIGYMVVSAVQLGATVDYAILLSDRYLAYRKVVGRREAAERAIDAAGRSIVASAAVMTAAGFTLGWVSGIPSVSALGILIGRGALLSCLMVLIVLPQLLVLGDGLIRLTTFRRGGAREAPSGD